MWWGCACFIFQEEMEITNGVENDWHVDGTAAFDFVKLFDCVVVFEVKAENGVQFLGVFAEATDQKDFGG